MESPETPLLQYCSGAVATLRAQYDMTKTIGHSGTSGSAREGLIQKFLIDHLPAMASVSGGVLIDDTGKRSKQQDLVLIKNNMPRLRFISGHELIFYDATVGTFEIKTSIDSRNIIKEVGNNLKSVNSLSTTATPVFRMGMFGVRNVITSVVTFGGSNLDTISSWIYECDEPSQPDIYLDLTQGIMTKCDLDFLPSARQQNSYSIVDNASRGLAHFLTIISGFSASISYNRIDWNKYIG